MGRFGVIVLLALAGLLLWGLWPVADPAPERSPTPEDPSPARVETDVAATLPSAGSRSELEPGTGSRKHAASVASGPGTGRVVDAAGRPVAAAGIFVIAHGRPETQVTVSDAGGRFSHEVLSEGVLVSARKAGFAPSRREFWQAGLELVLPEASAPVRGRVVHAGKGVPDAKVAIAYYLMASPTYSDYWRMPGRHLLTTAADGTFVADDLAAGTLSILVAAKGYAHRTVVLSTRCGEPSEVEIEVSVGWSVAGIVRDTAGQPLAKVSVQCEGLQNGTRRGAMSAHDGTFLLEHAAAPPQFVRFVKRGYAETRVPLAWSERGEIAQRIEATMSASPRISGRLQDDAGQPLAGWEIFAAHRIGTAGVTGDQQVTDAGGRFSLATEPNESYELWVSPPDNTPSVRAELGGPVQPGARDLLVVIPAAQRANAYVSGLLLDSVGAKVGHGSMHLDRDGGTVLGGVVAARMGSDGRFRLGPVPAGTYHLSHGPVASGSSPSTLLRTLRLQPHEDLELGTLRLPELGTLDLVLRDELGQPARPATVQVWRDNWFPAAIHELTSATSSIPLPPGEFHLDLLSNQYVEAARVPFAIRSGERTLLTVEVARAVRTELAIEVPLPAEERCSFVITRPNGSRETSDFERLAGGGRPLRLVTMTMLGRHEMSIASHSGRRFATGFTISSLMPSSDWLVLKASPR